MHSDSSRKKSSSNLDKQAQTIFFHILDNPHELFVGQECFSRGQIWRLAVPGWNYQVVNI